MYAFFACRGYNLDDLANMSRMEKIFLRYAQEQYWTEQAEFYKQIFGGDEN